MPAIERVSAVATQRVERLLIAMGRELRSTRVTRGLSQESVAAASGISQALLSMIERGRHHGVALSTLTRVAASVGLDLTAKVYPAGEPIRDRAHVALLERFRRATGSVWEWAAEVPLPVPGDRRAWDRVMRGRGVAIGVEAETRPTDAQELGRRLALKKRDGGVDRMILVLADTDWCRRFVRLNDLEAAFPVPGRVALRSLAEGRDPGGDAVVLV